MVRILLTASLLLVSGFCALVYETAWMRGFRLVFGGSTAASSVVLAVYMGGLGLGAALLGRRADRTRKPLALYGLLELGVAASAALSPLLIDVVQAAYVGLGGAATLGGAGALAVRLVLACLVLAAPTVLMGGTLPALARFAESELDAGRRTVGLLYGANTLGAVAGALTPAFVLFERLGIGATLWFACGLNLCVAGVALGAGWNRESELAPPEPESAEGAPRLLLVAAAVVGFAFLAMETVWFRMLSPVLGGSSYTFGVVLAVALFGLGAGALFYGSGPHAARPSLGALAVTCALEAALLLVPFALGDSLATFAIFLRSYGELGLLELALGWTLLTCIVVLPAALVSGYQLPLLTGLLGRGASGVGRQVGQAYAWNTAGSIAGALLGGLLLLPVLGAPVLWRAIGVLLAALGVGLGLAAGVRALVLPVALAAAVLALCTATGPTAYWRHSSIGAGRADLPVDANAAIRGEHSARRSFSWQAEGVEASLAMTSENGISFFVNGKSDGSARNDAPTTVMLSLVPAALHPNPERALVIGLGTGATAGWLAAVPAVKHVDVAELEPAVLDVAKRCAAANLDVLASPKVNLMFGDGREVLLTAREPYDLIVSEPSNPYRAGVNSLFTSEFYAIAARLLGERGMLAQWVQAYEVDGDALRVLIATARAEFPNVELWELKTGGDILLLARRAPFEHDVERVSARVTHAPFDRALSLVLGVSGPAGFYAGYLATAEFASRLLSEEPRRNTDDHPLVEFAYARNVGKVIQGNIDDLRAAARAAGEHLPPTVLTTIGADRVDESRATRALMEDRAADDVPEGDARDRTRARRSYAGGELADALQQWREQSSAPVDRADLLLVGEGMANAGEPAALDIARQLELISPAEAHALRAAYYHRVTNAAEAASELKATLVGARTDPWIFAPLLTRTLRRARGAATADEEIGRQLFAVLAEPFALLIGTRRRIETRLAIAQTVGFSEMCVAALADWEPHFPWDRELLAERVDCYTRNTHSLLQIAAADLARYDASMVRRFKKPEPAP